VRIQQSFFADLFLMLATAGPDQRMTATEVAERHEEKLLMLGPVLERLHNELLEPLIDITFDHMARDGALPPPPDALEGQDLSVEFISMLAQAQRAIGVNSVDRLLGTVGAISQWNQEVLDKIDVDAVVDTYADKLGVPPELIVSDDQVAMVREKRAEMQAAQAQTAEFREQAAAAKDLAAADTATQNALTDAVGMFSGYGSQQPPGQV